MRQKAAVSRLLTLKLQPQSTSNPLVLRYGLPISIPPYPSLLFIIHRDVEISAAIRPRDPLRRSQAYDKIPSSTGKANPLQSHPLQEPLLLPHDLCHQIKICPPNPKNLIWIPKSVLKPLQRVREAPNR